MKEDKHDILQRYLDGDLPGAEEADALQLIAGDPELRGMMRFELDLRQGLAGPSSRVPAGFADRVMNSVYALDPEKSRVAALVIDPKEESAGATGTAGMPENSVEHETSVKPLTTGPGSGGTGFANTIRNWLAALVEPRQVTWRPAWSVGLALGMVMLVVMSSWLTGRLTLQPQEVQPIGITYTHVAEESADRVLMRFVYVDRDAESVEVAGDFSDWEPIALTRVNINGDQAWMGLIPITRGEHRYMFIRNGEDWVTDPFAKTFRDDGFGNRNAVISL